MIGDVDHRSEQTVRDIEAAGGRAAYLPCDVSRSSQVGELVAACVGRFGRLDCAFNNAGILPPPVPLHEVTEENLGRILDVDLKGVFFCMQAEIRQFLKQGGGAIVNTASVAGIVADPNMSIYVAAKHAVVGLTKAAGLEYARRGIRVNAIGPGFVATPMTQAWLDDEVFRTAFLKESPIGRPAEPHEIAGTVLHLCSDDASFINGALFILDGGQTAH